MLASRVPHIGGARSDGRAIRGSDAPPATIDIRTFLRIEVLTPKAAPAGLVLTGTASTGYWVCAFTTATLLRRYAKAVTLPWTGDWLTLCGIDLVRLVRQLPMPAGVVLNPPSGTSAGSPLLVITSRQLLDDLKPLTD